MRTTQQIQKDDYDSPWKDILGEYFRECLAFFFPDVEQNIDWTRGYELLDKELRQITREAESGNRVADQLVKVWTTEGEETWVLIHVEVQAQRQSAFPQRMYVYNYRIYDLYQRPVASFGILADEHPNWRPSGFYSRLWRTRTLFRFPVIKILDYADQWEMLEHSQNPFAIVVQAHLKTLETHKDDVSRSRWKAILTKELYKRGLSKTDILNLFRFIDWIMGLPDALERQYYQEIVTFEEDMKMPFMTIAERIGLEKGLEQGEKQGEKRGEKRGLNKGEIIGEIRATQRFLKQPATPMPQLARKSLKSLKAILKELEAELELVD